MVLLIALIKISASSSALQQKNKVTGLDAAAKS